MMNAAPWLFVLGLSAVLAAGCGGSGGGAPPSAPSPLLEKPMKDFGRRTLSGKRVDTKQLRGRVVVLKFFAQYCKPCARTLPEVEQLHAELPEVAFIGVSEDEYESQAREMVSTHGLSFPVVHDRGNAIAGMYRITEMPATVVVDKTGRVAWVGLESASEAEVKAAILAARDAPR